MHPVVKLERIDLSSLTNPVVVNLFSKLIISKIDKPQKKKSTKTG